MDQDFVLNNLNEPDDTNSLNFSNQKHNLEEEDFYLNEKMKEFEATYNKAESPELIFYDLEQNSHELNYLINQTDESPVLIENRTDEDKNDCISEIIELDTNLNFLSSNEPVEMISCAQQSNNDNNHELSKSDQESIKTLLNELVDKVEKTSSLCSDLNKSKILIEKKTKAAAKKRQRTTTKTLSDILKSKCLYSTESQASKSNNKKELKTCELVIEEPFEEESKQSSKAYKIRLIKKKSILIIKETYRCIMKQTLDSENNILKTEIVDEKKITQNLSNNQKEKLLSEKKLYQQSKPTLESAKKAGLSSSSSSESASSEQQPKKQVKKSRKKLFTNRYGSKEQSEEEDASVKNKKDAKTCISRIRAKPKVKNLTQKIGKQKQQNEKTEIKTPQVYSFSNLRFELTPGERKKDLTELKKLSDNKQTQNNNNNNNNSNNNNDIIDSYLKDFGNFVEQNNFVESAQPEPANKTAKNKQLLIKCKKLDETEFNFYYQKYLDEAEKESELLKNSKFKLNDLVFSQKPNTKDGKFLPSKISRIHLKNTDFFYECKYFDREDLNELNVESDNESLFDSNNYLSQEQIIAYDQLKQSDKVMFYDSNKSKYFEALFESYSNSNEINNFLIRRRYNSASKKEHKFQSLAISKEEAEKILKPKIEKSDSSEESDLSDIEVINQAKREKSTNNNRVNRSSIVILSLSKMSQQEPQTVRKSARFNQSLIEKDFYDPKTRLMWNRKSNGSRSCSIDSNDSLLTTCRAVDTVRFRNDTRVKKTRKSEDDAKIIFVETSSPDLKETNHKVPRDKKIRLE